MYRARTQNLRVTRTDDGSMIVHDEVADVSHVLNPAVAIVFDACNGATTRDEMARRVAASTGLPESDDVVLLALAHLRDAALLDEAEPSTRELAEEIDRGPTRRQALTRLAITAAAVAAIPAVTTLRSVSALGLGSGSHDFVANAITVEAAANLPLSVVLGAQGIPERGRLTFEIVDQPRHGRVVIEGDVATYTPNPGFEGTDSYSYRAILRPGEDDEEHTTTTTSPRTPAPTPAPLPPPAPTPAPTPSPTPGA